MKKLVAIIHSNTTKSRYLTAGMSLLLFAASCALPAIQFTYDSDMTFGYEILLTGWLRLLTGLPTWYANIVYIFVLTTFISNKPELTLPLSKFMAILMSTMILLYFPIFPGDEGGVNKLVIEYLNIGAILWFASLLLPVYATYYHRKHQQTNTPEANS